jgi:hypothetical protein
MWPWLCLWVAWFPAPNRPTVSWVQTPCHVPASAAAWSSSPGPGAGGTSPGAQMNRDALLCYLSLFTLYSKISNPPVIHFIITPAHPIHINHPIWHLCSHPNRTQFSVNESLKVGWPDWAIFRLLGDSLLWAVFETWNCKNIPNFGRLFSHGDGNVY